MQQPLFLLSSTRFREALTNSVPESKKADVMLYNEA